MTRRGLRCVLFLIAVGLPLSGQATGSVSGSVVLAPGAPAVRANVTLVRAGAGKVVYASTLTSADGAYLFRDVTPGSYYISVRGQGLRSRSTYAMRVDPDVETSVDPISLGPGDIGGELARPNAGVTIASTADGRQMGALPLPRRDPMYLAGILPGVENNGRAGLGVYGESAALANIDYDGVNVGSSGLALRTDQVGEATTVTGSIDGCGCSQILFTAPAGGTAFHGSAYWLTIPSPTAAQLWADNARNTPAATSLNQLGATFGGPVRRNRLFFFASYEADLDRSTVTRTGIVPSTPLASPDPLLQQVLNLIPSDPSGRYRGVQNNGGTDRIALGRLDYIASARHALSATFADRRGTSDDPADSSVFGRKPTTTIGVAAPLYSGSWRWAPTARFTNEARAGANLADLDYRNSLRSRFGFVAVLDDPSVVVSQPMVGIDPQRRADHLYSYQDNLTWTPGPHILHGGVWLQQFRLNSDGFNNGPLDSLTVPRYVIGDIAQGAVTSVDQRFNIASPNSGYSSGSTARSRLSANLISGYLHDDWRVLRSLTVSFGLRFDYLSRANERTGAAIIPLLSGGASDAVYDQNLAFAFASDAHPFYRKDFDNYDPYIGLAWKPFSRRWLVVRGGFNIAYLNDDLLPNLSIYALRNPLQSFNVSTDLSAGPVPLSQAPGTPAPSLPSTLTLASLLSFANRYGQEPGTVYAIDPEIRTPNVKYWNIGVEGELSGFQLDLRYVGNRLEEGPRSIDRNQVMMSPEFLATFLQVQSALKSGSPTGGFPGLVGGGLGDSYARSLILTGQAGELARWYQGQGYNRDFAYNFLGNPLAPHGIDLLSQLGVSRYDALQVSASRHAGSGLDLSASYVFSKVLSTLNDYRPGAIDPYLNLHNPALEWAPSPFNLTHALKAAAVWDFPSSWKGRLRGGWSVAGIVIAQSGAPFSLLSGGTVVAPGGQEAAVSGLGTFTSIADSGQNTVVSSLTAAQIGRYFGIRKGPGGIVSYVDAPAGVFSEPAPGALGNLQRRMFSGPGAFNLNLGLRKTIPLSERARAELRAESINVLNNVNWLVSDQSYLGASGNQSVFDNHVAQWNVPRMFQFSVRLLF